MKFRSLFLTVIFFIFVLLLSAQTQAVTEVHTRTGEVFTGELENGTLEMVNSLGKFELNLQYLQSIKFQSDLKSNIKVKSIYDDRLSGILASDRIILRDENTCFVFNRENIQEILFDNSPDDYFDYSPYFHFYLKNGDYFTGNILGKFLEIESHYNDESHVLLHQLEKMQFFPADNENYSSVEISNTKSQENIKAALKEKNLYIWSPVFSTAKINHSYFELISRNEQDDFEYSLFKTETSEKDKEEIKSVVKRFVEAYGKGNLEFIENRLTTNFNYDHQGRDAEKNKENFLSWYKNNSEQLTKYEYQLNITTLDIIEDNKYEVLGTLTTRRNRVDHNHLVKFVVDRIDDYWKLLEFWYEE